MSWFLLLVAYGPTVACVVLMVWAIRVEKQREARKTAQAAVAEGVAFADQVELDLRFLTITRQIEETDL